MNVKNTPEFKEYSCHWERGKELGQARATKENSPGSAMLCLFFKKRSKTTVKCYRFFIPASALYRCYVTLPTTVFLFMITF